MLLWNEDENCQVTAHGLALYPPLAVDRRLRRDLVERGLSCPLRFHLTLKYAFVPSHDLTDRWDELERLVAVRPRLRLQSSGLLASPETFCHLLLIERDPDLMRLHDDVMRLLGSCGPLVSPDTSRFEGPGFNPHITLGYGASAADFEIQGALLAEYEPWLRFEIGSVERVDRRVAPDGHAQPPKIARSFCFGD